MQLNFVMRLRIFWIGSMKRDLYAMMVRDFGQLCPMRVSRVKKVQVNPLTCFIDKRNTVEMPWFFVFVVNNKEMGYNCT